MTLPCRDSLSLSLPSHRELTQAGINQQRMCCQATSAQMAVFTRAVRSLLSAVEGHKKATSNWHDWTHRPCNHLGMCRCNCCHYTLAPLVQLDGTRHERRKQSMLSMLNSYAQLLHSCMCACSWCRQSSPLKAAELAVTCKAVLIPDSV